MLDEMFVLDRTISPEEVAFLYEHRGKFIPTEPTYLLGAEEGPEPPCSELIDGQVLTESLTLPSGCVYNLPNGLSIQADNVVLDCHGALVNGTNLEGASGISARFQNNVTVLNCTVENYFSGFGINFEAITNSSVLHNTVTNTRGGLEINGSLQATGNIVAFNLVVNSTGEGIHFGTNGSQLLNNTIIFPHPYDGWGIHAEGSNNLISGNVVFAPPQPEGWYRYPQGGLLLAIETDAYNNTIMGNEFHNVMVELHQDYPEDSPVRAYDTVFVGNLLNNTALGHFGINTTFCREGVSNSFVGASGISTKTQIDFSPACVWNVPLGINIAASNIDFDCHGALINGTGEAFPDYIWPWPVGVWAYWRDNITVQNCVISNFYADTDGLIGYESGFGIVLEEVTNSTVRNNRVVDAEWGIWVNGTERAMGNLVESNIIDTAQDGLYFGGNHSVARNNTIRNVARDWSITVGGSHLLVEGNTVFGNPDNPWEPGALAVAPSRQTEDIVVLGNEFHGGVVVVSDWGGFIPENITFLGNLLNNSFFSQEVGGTRLCDNGTFNTFIGSSGIVTRVAMDLNPSCAWNLPQGIALEGFENATIDCQGALINGTNDLDWAWGISGWGRPRNVTIRNCTIMNYNPPEMIGGAIALNGEDLTITGNTIDNTTFGVYVDFGEKNYRVTIEDNTFVWTRWMSLNLDVDDSVIRGNTFLESVEGANLNFGGNNVLVEGNLFNGSRRHVYSGSLRNVTFRDNIFRGVGKTETAAIQFWLWPIEDVTIADNDIRDAYLALGDLSVMPEIIPVRLAMERNTLDNVGRVEIPYWDDSTIAFNNITADSVNLSLTGSRVERNDFTGTGSTIVLAGNATMYANNAFNDAVMMRDAFNNTFTNNTYANTSFSLDNTTVENLLYENAFSGTQIDDSGVNNIWCVNSVGNDYSGGASYTGSDPYGGTCPALDEDDDGVQDDVDQCPGTILPELLELNPNHYADVDGDGVFETVEQKGKDKVAVDSEYTLTDTHGCSCEQILDLKPGEDKGLEEAGCTAGIMQDFIDDKGWAK